MISSHVKILFLISLFCVLFVGVLYMYDGNIFRYMYSLAIFCNLQLFLTIFGKCLETFVWPSEFKLNGKSLNIFGSWSEILGKSPQTMVAWRYDILPSCDVYVAVNF